ncbi:L-2-hydroxyglutarate oxidase [Suttonella sp. R2A3]|uniref:L-2-hydroxyglutarate oxidase n=1 Tax=Suttonella sp. R2A3 TaxID=2908648 RepID=UPI001F2471AD|nr:L-2-hydroxyglutarate oxidase [Suttonella sp. R2A3]UJF24323.1 L-2-hydroxyglutarate oxidase [Suttonella sp. R2A3]
MNVDLVIIGAGIVGMATALAAQRRFPDRRIVVLDKAAHAAAHQTGHNSGVIHAGVYYPPGSLKAELCRAGNAATKAFCDAHAIDYSVCGKLLVASNEAEVARMEGLYERCAENGLERSWWSADELREREPNIVGLAAVHVPSTGIVSYAAITEEMVEVFCAGGGEVFFNSEVIAINERKDGVGVQTEAREINAQFMIACAGLQADRVLAMMGQKPDFVICPFRGEYYQLPAKHNDIVHHLIYPIPEPGVPFLGVHLTRMIDGSVTVGPNAVLAMAREGYRKRDIDLGDLWQMITHRGIRRVLAKNWRHGLKEQGDSWFRARYLRAVQKYCPSIGLEDLQPYPSGVRAQAVSDAGELIEDFLWRHTPRSLHVCNAPSPAATSAMPIAERIIATLDKTQKHYL